MKNKDELFIQLINEEIQGKGGGFEKFCELLTDEISEIVKKVFPSDELQQKKAVKQVLVRLYQRIDMADQNNIHEWIEQFTMEILEKNYPKETLAAKKRKQKKENLQENVLNPESKQAGTDSDDDNSDELIAAAMAAFERIQDGQSETVVHIPKEAESFFKPEQSDFVLEISEDDVEHESFKQPKEDRYSKEKNKESFGELLEEPELEIPQDYEAGYAESEDDDYTYENDEREDREVYLAGGLSQKNLRKIIIAAIPCVVAIIAVITAAAGGSQKKTTSVNHTASIKQTQAATTVSGKQTTAETTAGSTTAEETQKESETDKETKQTSTQSTTKKSTQSSGGGQASATKGNTTQRTTQAATKTESSTEEESSEAEETQEKTTEAETEPQTEEKTTKQEKTTVFETQAPTTKPSMSAAVRE